MSRQGGNGHGNHTIFIWTLCPYIGRYESRCKIGDEGARCLADALRSNTCLRELR